MTAHRAITHLIVAVATLFLVSGTGAQAAPSPTASPSAAAPLKPVKASGAEVKAVTGVISALYAAYTARDIDAVIALERRAFEAAAESYEKQGKGKASDVIDAFRGATEDILKHKDFSMKPLNLADAQFQRLGDRIVVTSVIPIIATEAVDVGDPSDPKKVRLRIGRFVLEPVGSGYQIVRMDFF